MGKKEKCEHKNLKKLYHRKKFPGESYQRWIIINDFLICDGCGIIFKIKEKMKIKEINHGRKKVL